MNENVAAPKTVIYKGVTIDRDDYIYPYRFNFYVIHAAGIRAGTFKGWDWYSNTECRAQTIEEARAEVDRHLAIAGIEAVAPPPSGRAAVETAFDKSTVRPAWVIYRDGTDQKIG